MDIQNTTPEQILHAVSRAVHPTYGIDPVNLGMIYGIELGGDRATVTLSYPTSDASSQAVTEYAIRESILRRHTDLTEVAFVISNDPPWRDDFITPEGRLQMRNPLLPISATATTESDILTSLQHVIDPEVGVNVVDLGLIYGVNVRDAHVRITMTLTTPGCPLHASIEEAARRVIETRHPDIASIDVDLVWDPPWDTDRITPEGKRALGW